MGNPTKNEPGSLKRARALVDCEIDGKPCPANSLVEGPAEAIDAGVAAGLLDATPAAVKAVTAAPAANDGK